MHPINELQHVLCSCSLHVHTVYYVNAQRNYVTICVVVIVKTKHKVPIAKRWAGAAAQLLLVAASVCVQAEFASTLSG